MRGYYQPSGTTIPPFPDSGLPITYVASDAMLLREPRTDFGKLVEVHLYGNGSDTYIDDAAHPPAGFTDLGFEGYVLASNVAPDQLVPLDVQTNGTDTLTTTLSLPGYTRLRTLGFTLRGETKAAPTD